MYVNQIFELSMMLDHEKFQKVLHESYSCSECSEEYGDEYTDRSLTPKGITVIYRDSRRKKKVRMVVNTHLMLDDASDTDKLARKLEKTIGEYFNFKYHLEDFHLSGMSLITDIDVGNSKTVSDYLRVFHRIRRVKGFSPSDHEGYGDDSFCLHGNSNGIDFLIYDLEKKIMGQLNDTDMGKKRLKYLKEHTNGMLRTEVRLMEARTISFYSGIDSVSGQIRKLSKTHQDIFLDVFTRIIPYGDYYKKDAAEKIIYQKVSNINLRRRMLQFIELISVKKSIYLALKSMSCQNRSNIMDSFKAIHLSPVVISKRHDIKHLKNLYEHFLEEN